MGQQIPINNIKSMTVLVIDDHFSIRKAIRRVLLGMGFGNVIECADGSHALNEITKNNVDLVICDLFLQNVDGFQTLKNIRSQDFRADLPVIIITGEDHKDDIVKAVDLGADDYILKPFNVKDLEKKIQTLLSNYLSPPPLLHLLRQGDKLSLSWQFKDALKLFEAAERLDPESARAKCSKALILYKLGHIPDALMALKASLAINPTYYKSFRAMANILIAQKQRTAAVEALKSELDLNPKQPERQMLLAKNLHLLGNFEGAVRHYRIALHDNIKDKEALVGIAQSYEKLGQFDSAIAYYRRARRYHPTWTKPLELIVKLLDTKNDPNASITFLIDEIHQNPGRHDARLMLAKLHSSRDDHPSAIKILDQGLKFSGREPLLLKAKAKLLLAANNIESACQVAQNLAEAIPSESNRIFFASCLMSAHRHQNAYDTLFLCLHDTIDRPKILKAMSEVLRQMDCTTQALVALQLAKKAAGPSAHSQFDELIHQMMFGVKQNRQLLNDKKAG